MSLFVNANYIGIRVAFSDLMGMNFYQIYRLNEMVEKIYESKKAEAEKLV